MTARTSFTSKYDINSSEVTLMLLGPEASGYRVTSPMKHDTSRSRLYTKEVMTSS